MRVSKTNLLIALAVSGLVFTGCEGCDDPVAPIDDPGDLDPNNENGKPDPEEEKEEYVLTYEGAQPVEVYYGQQQVLSFRLKTVSGAPVSGEDVTFTSSNPAAVTAFLIRVAAERPLP